MFKPFRHSAASPIGTAWLLSYILAGCTASLPPAPPALAQAPNCGDVRNERLARNVTRPLGLDPSEAERQAIDATLSELARQSSGGEFRSLSRAADSLNNETYSSEFQSADYAKTVGRILDYRVLDVRHQTVADERQIHVEVEGRVCADTLVNPPLIVAIRETTGLSTYGLEALESALSKSLARDPRLALADKMASDTYHDIEIRASIDRPRFSSVDRRAAISAIQANVGPKAVAGVVQHATRVTLRATLKATLHESGLGFTEIQTVERELIGSAHPSATLIAEMERDVLQLTGQALAETLSKHVKKTDR